VAHSYPILLDLTGKLIVIVGGGKVAVRKARGVLDAGATKVRCVAPQIDNEMPQQVELVHRKFEPSDLDGAAMVFAATDDAGVNTAVVRAAQERGILVCRADSDEVEGGDFTVPAVLRHGSIVISFSAGSPTLSVTLRDEFRTNISTIDKYKEMARLLRTLRPRLRDSSALTPVRRKQALFDLASSAALTALADGNNAGLWRWLVERYPELSGEKAP